MIQGSAFFLKDLRTSSRRDLHRLCWLLFIQACLFSGALLFLEFLRDRGYEDHPVATSMGLTLWAFFHIGIVSAAGNRQGELLLRDEHRRGTLEGLQLLALPAWRVILQKLLFPLFSVGVVWLTALPFYAAAMVREYHLPRELAGGALLALLAGLIQVGAGLLMPPEGLPPGWAMPRERSAPSRLEARRWPPMALPAVMGAFMLLLFGAWLSTLSGPRPTLFRPSPFYGGQISMEVTLLVLLGLYWIAAVLIGVARLSPASDLAERLARAAPLVFLTVAYYLFVGAVWFAISWPWRAAWAAALPAVTLVLFLRQQRRRQRERKRDDPRAAAEIARLAERWENPLFVRDLRACLRAGGLRRLARNASLAVLIAPLVLASLSMLGPFGQAFGMVLGTGRPAALEILYRAGFVVCFYGPLFVFAGFAALGSRAQILWHKEHLRETLSQLLNTPLSPDEVVRGRLAASAVVALPAVIPGLLLAIPFGGAMMASQYRIAYYALDLLLMAVGLLLAVVLGAVHRRGEWRFPLLYAGILLSELAVVLWLTFSLLDPQLMRGPLSVPVGLALSAAVLNAGLIALVYRRSVAEVVRLRVEAF